MKNFREAICDRCNKSILEETNFNYYKTIPNFFKDNHSIFCKCYGRGISAMDAEYLEIQYNLKKNNKFKKY